ncbi:MAG TPA: MFS transporter [Gemmatimonadales bacterium]|nr:MFS transporter [Gemmatimonadales bacterium]
MTSIFSRHGVPVFASFFLWSFGTGGMRLARPLFAASFGVPLVLVTLIISSNTVSQLIAAPVTGHLIDRWGRRPLLIAALALRGATCFAIFFAGSYLEFLIYEFIGGVGVSMWVTSSTVLVADMSVAANRGRVVAARNIASRIGFVTGPFVAAAIAGLADLRWVFIFNGITKVLILAIVFWLVGETRPEAAAGASRPRATLDRTAFAMFLSRQFLAIAVVAWAVAMMTQGLFQSLFPLYLQTEKGFSTGEVGHLIAIAGVATLLVSMPNGYVVDAFGRKLTLIPGLVVLGLSAPLLVWIGAGDLLTAVAVMVLYGIGEGVCFGASQAYAMDLAPEQRRGAFLGVWSLVSHAGAAFGPVATGLLAQTSGYPLTFGAAAGLMVLSAALMWALGPDTRARRGAPATAAA